MLLEKETLNDLKENYAKVRKLLDEDSKLDPDTEPYLSKYAARAILVHMKHSLTGWLEKLKDRPQKIKIISMLGAVLYNIGVVNLDTDETGESEKVLSEGETLLKEYRLHPQIVVVLVNIYNHLGILWSNSQEIEKTEQYLSQGKNLYTEFCASGEKPFDISQLFTGLDEDEVGSGEIALEKAHTLTLYYMAQVFGALKQNTKSAYYCQITLKRQLRYDDYEPVDWALNSATLSQYFALNSEFEQARAHLAAASIVLKRATCEDERQKHRAADVARCWAKYCLLLMAASKDRLMEENVKPANVTQDFENLNLDESNALENEPGFFGVDLLEYTDKITAKYLLTYDDARKVFLSCQEFINEAKDYYKLDSLASDHIELVQDHSNSFNSLAFFEDNDERQAKMHKRRIVILEELLNEINPKYYMQYCQQIWFELGQVYTDLLNIKLDKLKKTDERPTPHALSKINHLAEQSVNYFETFLGSIKEPSSKELPNKIDSQVVHPALTALVLIARSKMKIITPDKAYQLKNIKESMEAYLQVVNYCKKDEEAAQAMREELSLCKEMASMLPLKINKLESELGEN